ncbi:MAG: hypothetical protein ACAH80_04380 [Alphaproteobacteria bacterium]
MIGPHAGIEAELLLNGTKRLGWIDIVPPWADANHPPFVKARALEQRLDEAVAEGRLSAIDVTVPRPNNLPGNYIYRHYCQKGLEADLEKVAAFNSFAFNRKSPEGVTLDKSFGDYLGYRKRDQLYWKYSGDIARHLPRTLNDALADFNAKVTKPAYQQEALKRKSTQPKI